jgi:hypothetical protein
LEKSKGVKIDPVKVVGIDQFNHFADVGKKIAA